MGQHDEASKDQPRRVDPAMAIRRRRRGGHGLCYLSRIDHRLAPSPCAARSITRQNGNLEKQPIGTETAAIPWCFRV